ncbi:hypothetical protein AB9128_10050 [Streptomyces cinereoruber]|uniref:hypothetical protein n=1 Tax=Streptomyces cinereoruber TaxID=67260 RepID=UPI003EB9BD07
MPTITVESTLEDLRAQRRFAKNVSLWLHGEGVDINHVITKFLPADPQRVFSGPYPLGGPGLNGRRDVQDAREEGRFALVRCTVDADRPARFRDRLAERIVTELAGHVTADRVFIQFDLVRPELHVIGSQLGAAVSRG